jgi:type I restriction enzyme M protein
LTNFGEYVSFIWNVADLLRGPYRPNQYGRMILPMTVLRRLDCVLEPTKDKVLRKNAELKGKPDTRSTTPAVKQPPGRDRR